MVSRVGRAYSLAGAAVLVYPTAIGSEPDHPDFDTEPLWEQVIVGNGIANGTFMVAVNRIGLRGSDHVLRLVVHLRSVRAQAGPGTVGTSRPSWSPTSTSTSAATGWSSFPSSPPAGPTPTSRSSATSATSSTPATPTQRRPRTEALTTISISAWPGALPWSS